MIDHTGISVASVARAAAFYDAALGALGCRRVVQLPQKAAPTASDMARIFRLSGLIVFTPMEVKQHTAFAAKTFSRTQLPA
jgi:catechol 2,3-dioxygenase-like lactoylglutathione lyase family enzyme